MNTIKNFSFPKMRNRQLIFSPKIPYNLVAERSEAASSGLQFSFWCVYLTKSEPFLNGTDRRASRAKLNARAGPIAKPSACYGASKKEEFLFTP